MDSDALSLRTKRYKAVIVIVFGTQTVPEWLWWWFSNLLPYKHNQIRIKTKQSRHPEHASCWVCEDNDDRSEERAMGWSSRIL